MADALVHRLEVDILDETASLDESPLHRDEVRARLMTALERIRLQISRQDALRLEMLIERRTKARP
ncbi:MAG: hypothetical protein RL756_1738 [Pseudomonadota bacterium]|jgi:hypothetical protein